MRITIKQKEPIQPKLFNLQTLEPGTVVTLLNGPTALVVEGMERKNRELIMLTHNGDGTDGWFSVPGGWNGKPITKVFGKIVEIIVEPI